jgi:hypothetical protein
MHLALLEEEIVKWLAPVEGPGSLAAISEVL